MIRVCFVAIGLIFGCFTTSSVHAQNIVVPARGTECFRDDLSSLKLTPMSRMRDLVEDPAQSILIVFGDTSIVEREITDVQNFLLSGGALLICSDQPTGIRLESLLRVAIQPQFVRASNDANCYLGIRDFPIVRPFFTRGGLNNVSSPQSIFKNPLFLSGKIFANLPSTVTRKGIPDFRLNHTIEPLAGFEGEPVFSNGEPLNPNQHYFSIGGRYSHGRYMLLADQDLFQNQSMVLEEYRNRELARSIIDWLQRDDYGRIARRKVLFYDEGQIQRQFELYPKPPWHAVVNHVLDKYGDRIIAQWQEKDQLHEWLYKRTSYPAMIRSVLFSLLAFCAFTCFFWMLRRKHRIDYTVDEASKVVGRIPTGGALSQRYESLLGTDNLIEPFRLRLRERFDLLGGQPDEEGRPPLIEIDKQISDPRVLRGRVLEFWEIAYGQRTVPITLAQWELWNRRFAILLQDAMEGRWRFEPRITTK